MRRVASQFEIPAVALPGANSLVGGGPRGLRESANRAVASSPSQRAVRAIRAVRVSRFRVPAHAKIECYRSRSRLVGCAPFPRDVRGEKSRTERGKSLGCHMQPDSLTVPRRINKCRSVSSRTRQLLTSTREEAAFCCFSHTSPFAPCRRRRSRRRFRIPRS